MLIQRLIGVSIFLLFYGCPLAAQSPTTQQEIVKPVPKQERTTPTGSPTQTGQHEENSDNHQHTTNKPTTSVAEIKPTVENDTSNNKYNYEAQNLEIQRQLAEATQTISNFTIALVFVGVVQAIIFLIHGLLLRGTLKATEKAANAADAAAKLAQDQSVDMKASIAIAEKAAKAAEDSVEVAKKSLNTTRRAYVFLKDIEVREIKGKGSSLHEKVDRTTWQLFPRWQNSGDTPTRKLVISMGCRVFDRFPPHNFPFPYINKELKELSGDCCYSYDTKIKIPVVIGPKAAIITLPLIISEHHSDITEITKDRLSLYVWGEAKYNDVFDTKLNHCTRFFVKLWFPEKFIEQPLLIYYERYTCADEDCDKQS